MRKEQIEKRIAELQKKLDEGKYDSGTPAGGRARNNERRKDIRNKYGLTKSSYINTPISTIAYYLASKNPDFKNFTSRERKNISIYEQNDYMIDRNADIYFSIYEKLCKCISEIMMVK